MDDPVVDWSKMLLRGASRWGTSSSPSFPLSLLYLPQPRSPIIYTASVHLIISWRRSVSYSACKGIELLAGPGEGYSTLGLCSFLYASKRCSSRSDHLLLLVRDRAALLGLVTISIIASEVRIFITWIIVIAAAWRFDLLQNRSPNVNGTVGSSSGSKTTGPCTR